MMTCCGRSAPPRSSLRRTDYSRDLLRQRLSDSATKIYRVYKRDGPEAFSGEARKVGGYSARAIIRIGRLLRLRDSSTHRRFARSLRAGVAI